MESSRIRVSCACVVVRVHDPSVAACPPKAAVNPTLHSFLYSSSATYNSKLLTLNARFSGNYQHVSVGMYPPFDYFEHRRAW